MTLFLCKLWPYLAGGLVGWLLTGWLARRLKQSEPAVERITEKVVDRVVDNPELLARIKKLEEENSQIVGLKNKISSFEGSGPKVVEREVEKHVDNPMHISRIAELEEQIKNLKQGPKIDLKAAKAAGIAIKSEDDLTAIEGIGSKINDLIKADGIRSFYSLAATDPATIQKTLDNAGSRYAMANPGTWPDQANLAANNRWPALKALQDVLVGGVYPDGSSTKTAGSNKSSKGTESNRQTSILDLKAAKAAGFRIRQKEGQDDFTVVEGIGPKINELIHDAGIHTYSELGRTFVEDVQKILDAAGPRYKLAQPSTWPAQADMAAANKWEALKAWQDQLDGGK